jgi:hypothetical protein
LREGKNNQVSKAEEKNFHTEDLETGSTDATTEDLPGSMVQIYHDIMEDEPPP